MKGSFNFFFIIIIFVSSVVVIKPTYFSGTKDSFFLRKRLRFDLFQLNCRLWRGFVEVFFSPCEQPHTVLEILCKDEAHPRRCIANESYWEFSDTSANHRNHVRVHMIIAGFLVERC